MTFPVPEPKNRTEGLKNFVAIIANQLEAGNVSEAQLLLCDLWNDIGGAYKCLEVAPRRNCPVNDYNPETDGPYDAWLVQNNID